MLEIELCRICLADSIRMYPIERTRYHEVFEWYTEDTMDMNDELPYSVCYLCNAVLNRLHNFLKNMIDTEIYLKEILRTSSKLTYERIEKLKSEMISKPYNLSKIWLKNSNFVALDLLKGHRPPRALQRYFNHPPIMVEYHKPYEHMKLEDIPEEEPEEVHEKEPDETNEAENEEEMEVESDQFKEAKIGEIKDQESSQQKSKLPKHESKSSKHNEEKSQDQPKPPKEFKNQSEHSIKVSETSADQEKFANDDDEDISIGDDISLVWSSDNEPPIKSNMEIDNEVFIDPIDSFLLCAKKYKRPEETAKSINKNLTKKDHESKSSEHNEEKSQDKFANDDDDDISIGEDISLVWSPDTENEPPIKSNMELDNELVIDPIDSYLLCTKKYNHPKETAKSINKNVTKKDHNPYLEFIEERIPIQEKPQEKKNETSEPVKYHDSLQEQRIPTQESPPKKRLKTSEERVKTPDPEKYQNQNLQLIEHILVKETEPEHISKQMKIDENIHTNTPPVQQKSTELTATQLEESYYNLYLESVKDTPIKISNEPKVIEKCRGSNKPVSKTIKPTKANEPVKIIVTSEPKKYINSYVDFVKTIGDIENIERESNQEIVATPPKYTRKHNLKKKIILKVVPKTPVQEKPFDIDSKINGYCYFDHQKRYHRASILRKTRHPNRNKPEIEELANKIKNRAAELRKKPLKFRKTDPNAEKVLEKNAVTKPAPDDKDQSPGISKLRKEISLKHLPLKSKKHSDKLVKDIPLKLLPDSNNKKVWLVVKYPVKSKHTGRVCDEHKDQNQDNQYEDQVTLKDQPDQKLRDQNDGINLEDQEDTNGQIWSDQDDNTMESQVNRALKVLDESLQDEDRDLILQNKDDQEHNVPNDHMLTGKNDPPLPLKDDCIIVEDDPSIVVQDVFTLKDQCSDDEHLIPKEQYDRIIMMANQDDQVIEDGNVAVKIESVDEDFQVSFEENHEKENVISDTETVEEDIMDPKMEVEQNMQIDDEVSEYEPYLQETATVNKNTTKSDQVGPSNNHNEIQGLNEQEHYKIRTVRQIRQIRLMPTVQLERLPIARIKTSHENDKYNCAHCDFKTTVRLAMFRHQNVHDMNKRFVCNVCQHRFLSNYHLSRHKVIHDRTKYYCSYCDFKTTVKFVMERHEKGHNKYYRFPCQWCQKRFQSSSHHSRHACTNKPLRKCEECHKEFKIDANYFRHLATHTGVTATSFNCSSCSKSFDKRKEYLNHIKQHRRDVSEIKDNTCKWCDKKFRHRRNFKKHMRWHEIYAENISSETENKQKMNKTENEMELHGNESDKEDEEMNETENEIELHGNEGEKFPCGLCPQSFDTEKDLGRHAIDHIL